MTKKRIFTAKNIVLAICSIFIIGIGFGFLPEILGGELEAKLRELLGDNYLPVLLGFLGFVVIVWLLVFFYEKGETESEERESAENLRAEFLLNLRKLYEKRLYDKMLGELNFEIKLNLKYTTRGNSPETIEEFFIAKNEIHTGDFDRLFKNYINRFWRLLILGEPGAGKSIILLQFGLRLLEMAEKDPKFPIPVLFDLATWKDKNQKFEEWLELNLSFIGGSFTVSKDFAKKMVAAHQVLPLLDGFDEIRPDFRNSCFAQLMIYLQRVKNVRKEAYPEVIICSRILEYESAIDAPVFASIMIQAIDEKEVNKVLKPLAEKKNFVAAKRLQIVLKEKPALYSAITSAFFLHTLLNIAQNKRPDFQQSSKETLQKEITAFYIATEIEKVTIYDKEKTKKYLGWLAWKMKFLENRISFELIDLQPWWARRKYVYTLIIGGIAFVFWSLFSVYLLNLVYGWFLGALAGIGIALDSDQIKTKERKRLKINSINMQIFKESMIDGLGTAVFSYLCIWGLSKVGFNHGVSSFWGAMAGFGIGFLSEIVEQLSVEPPFPKIDNPYQRFLAQFGKDFFQWAFILSLIIGVLSYVLLKSYYGFLVSVIVALGAAIIFSPLFKHICLRFALWMEGDIPKNLVSFLNAVSETGLMTKDGGKWRFRHQLIHDDLAIWFEKNHSGLLREKELEVIKGREIFLEMKEENKD